MEDDEVNLVAESFYSEAGGSHPHHCSIPWTSTHLPLPSQSQPIGQRDVHRGDESEDTTSNGETHNTSLGQLGGEQNRRAAVTEAELARLE